MLVWRLFIANLKMTLRNRQALFWALVFPLVFVTVFGLFKFDSPGSSKMAVVDLSGDRLSRSLRSQLAGISYLALQDMDTEDAARQALRDGEVDFVLVLPAGLEQQAQSGQGPAQLSLIYDEANGATNGLVVGVVRQFLNNVNLQLANAPERVSLETSSVASRRLSYFDFVLPGLMGMGVMNYGIIGLAATMTFYRKQRVFRRLQATPLPVSAFFVAQVLNQLVIAVVQAAIILAAGVFIFHGHVYGNLLTLFGLILFGDLVFLNLGFIVGAFANSPEAASGLGNLVALPMMFFSGVFFPTSSLPVIMAKAVSVLPLTQLLDAMRQVMTDAAPLTSVTSEMAILGAWVVGSALVAVRVFKFS